MKKGLKIVKDILVWAVVAVAVFMMIFTIISVTTFDRNDRGVFGLKFFVVQTDSMSATDFSAGDIAISKKVDPTTLKEGDIITFVSQNPDSFGENITHKIRKLTTDDNGDKGFITYGTTTNTDDDRVVTYPYIVGKYVGHIPGIGRFFLFLKTTPGYIVCILVPFLLLILYQGLNVIRLFKKYKQEQVSKLEEERKQLEEERKQQTEMMLKLQALQAQLASQGAGGMAGMGVQTPNQPYVDPNMANQMQNGGMNVQMPDQTAQQAAPDAQQVNQNMQQQFVQQPVQGQMQYQQFNPQQVQYQQNPQFMQQPVQGQMQYQQFNPQQVQYQQNSQFMQQPVQGQMQYQQPQQFMQQPVQGQMQYQQPQQFVQQPVQPQMNVQQPAVQQPEQVPVAEQATPVVEQEVTPASNATETAAEEGNTEAK